MWNMWTFVQLPCALGTVGFGHYADYQRYQKLLLQNLRSYFLLLLLLFSDTPMKVVASSSGGSNDLMQSDTKACCLEAGVSEFCSEKLCNVDSPPNEFEVFDVANRCPNQLPTVARCLADGRNYRPCCQAVARGTEEDCLGLCDGSQPPLNSSNWDSYKHFVACMSFNVASMYECITEGSVRTPGPPHSLKVVEVGATTVELNWSPPKKNAEFATEYRIVYRHYDDNNAADATTAEQQQILTTSRTYFVLEQLSPDTKYIISVIALNQNELSTSLGSAPNTVLTKGVSPTIRAFSEHITAARGTDQNLVCLVELQGVEHIANLELQWTKETTTGSGNFVVVQQTNNVQASSYVASSSRHPDRTSHVMALKLEAISEQQFGVYRCSARNSFGQSSSDIRLEQNRFLPPAPTVPPNLTDCCVAAGVQQKCLSSCRGEMRRPLLNTSAAAVLSSSANRHQCAADLPKVLKCSTAGFHQATCCLRRRVPLKCLSFCDGSIPNPLPYSMYMCLLHTSDILNCHVEAKRGLPHPPRSLHVTDAALNSVTVHWNSVSTASAYHIYYRKASTTAWEHRTVEPSSVGSQPRLTIRGLLQKTIYEFVVVAANEAGTSGSSRPLRILTGVSLTKSVLSEESKEATAQSASVEQDWTL